MKNLSLIIILILSLLVLISCAEKDDGNDKGGSGDGSESGIPGGFNGEDDVIDYGEGKMDTTFSMTATVIEKNGDVIEVDVISAPYENSGTFWVRTHSGTEFFDSEGRSVSLSDIKVGDKVTVTYSGQVMMSYPPQIVAHSITVK